jgi:polygalacturonase
MHRYGNLSTWALLCLLIVTGLAGAPDGTPAVVPSDEMTLDVRHFGAVGDGKADDTAAIQRAVDGSNGGIWIPRGRYRVTKTITVDLDRVGPTSIRGDAAATILMNGPGPAFRFVGSHEGTAAPDTVKDDVWRNQRAPMVDAIEIVGGHEEADGIEAAGTMKMILSRVVIRRYHYGDGADAKLGMVFVDSSDCTIASNHIYGTDNLPAAVLLRHCRRFNITGCTILDAGNCGLMLDDVSKSRVSDCLIRDDRDGSGNNHSLRVIRSRENMIVNNLFGNRTEIDSASSHIAGNVAVKGGSLD